MMQSISKRRALVAVRLEPPMNGANPVAKPSVLPRPTITTGETGIGRAHHGPRPRR